MKRARFVTTGPDSMVAHLEPGATVLCPTCTSGVGQVDGRGRAVVASWHCRWRFRFADSTRAVLYALRSS